MSESFEFMGISLWNDTFTKKRLTQELVYDSETDIENVTNVLQGLLNSGWMIDDVYVNTNACVTPVNATDSETVLALLDALIDETYDTTRILVYGEAYGWHARYFESGRYDREYNNGYYREGDSREDVVQEHFYEFHQKMMEEIENTSYLSIDWDHTANQMEMDGWTFHERNGYTYLLTSE